MYTEFLKNNMLKSIKCLNYMVFMPSVTFRLGTHVKV